MDEWIVPAVCVAGVIFLAFHAAAHDAAHGLRYWQPERIMAVGAGVALMAIWLALALAVAWMEEREAPPEAAPPPAVSAD